MLATAKAKLHEAIEAYLRYEDAFIQAKSSEVSNAGIAEREMHRRVMEWAAEMGTKAGFARDAANKAHLVDYRSAKSRAIERQKRADPTTRPTS
jgi:hypothetical protein